MLEFLSSAPFLSALVLLVLAVALIALMLFCRETFNTDRSTLKHARLRKKAAVVVALAQQSLKSAQQDLEKNKKRYQDAQEKTRTWQLKLKNAVSNAAAARGKAKQAVIVASQAQEEGNQALVDAANEAAKVAKEEEALVAQAEKAIEEAKQNEARRTKRQSKQRQSKTREATRDAKRKAMQCKAQ